MDPLLSQWLNLVLRWIHVIVGIAWIGTSFYFNWLNSRFESPQRAEEGVAGELWSVHGGGFYRVLKYNVAPAQLPQTLHWFKWEAYATWISGISLLALIYYLNADAYLLDPAVSGVGAGTAIAAGIGTLVAGWLVYDILCKSRISQQPLVFTLTGLILITAAAYGLTQVLSSRGAYIHVGALLGTLMAGNVFRIIIPYQKQMVQAMREGNTPNAALGAHAANRSLHNNYMTLPVLFIMVSNHYPFTYGHAYNWAILAALAVIGAATRHYFNLRNQGRAQGWILPVAAAGIVGLAVVTAPRVPPDDPNAREVSFAQAQAIVERRCTPCHSTRPTQPGFPLPPMGVAFDTPEQILSLADRIGEVSVDGETMPLGNLTSMTPEERETLGRWIRHRDRQP